MAAAHLRPFLLASMLAATMLRAETFEVTRADDPAPDGCLAGDCSLREAIEAAQATPAADAIVLEAGQYFVTRGDLQAFGSIVLEGAGSTATEVIASGTPSVLRIAAQSDFVLRGVRLVGNSGTAISAGDHSTTRLEGVDIPVGEVAAGDDGNDGEVELRVRDSSIGYLMGCVAADGLCELVDSTTGAVGAVGERVALRVARSQVLGGGDAGVIAYGGGDVLLEDSVVGGAARPLELLQFSAPGAADVWIRRTRFIGNTGPIRAVRDSTMHFDDVEFRDNIVDADHFDQPAVLLAEGTGAWRIERALFVGNRGGSGLDGAVVRVLGGANVVMDQVTFDDNTFHPDANGVFGHTIGVYANSADPTFLRMYHATMRAAPSVPDGTPGSLLTVRGGNANVRVFNSVIDGSCAFSSGGSMSLAEGNIESPADTCSFDSGSNEVGVPSIQLHLGALGDHGGFTHTYQPALGSLLVDHAKENWCLSSPLDQRRYLRPTDGVACDVGAVEAGAVADTIFEDGFEP